MVLIGQLEATWREKSRKACKKDPAIVFEKKLAIFVSTIDIDAIRRFMKRCL